MINDPTRRPKTLERPTHPLAPLRLARGPLLCPILTPCEPIGHLPQRVDDVDALERLVPPLMLERELDRADRAAEGEDVGAPSGRGRSRGGRLGRGEGAEGAIGVADETLLEEEAELGEVGVGELGGRRGSGPPSRRSPLRARPGTACKEA